MNTDRSDFDRALRAWFSDGPTVMSDRVVDGISDRIARQPQRRTWRLQRRLVMNTYAKLAVAAAAVVIVGLVGWQLLPGSGGFGGRPTPSPAPTASPTQRVAPTPTSAPFECEDGLPGCAGVLPAGTHRTAQFNPTFDYTTPADWMNPIDVPTVVGITPVNQPADLILIWSDVAPAETTAACVLQAKPGTGATVDAWITYLDEHPGLDAQNIRTLSIGGATAKSIDVRSFGGWSSPCAADREDYNVPFLKTPDGAPGDGYGVAIGAIARVYAIDAGGETVIVTVYKYGDDADFDAAVAMAEPVVETFNFTAP